MARSTIFLLGSLSVLLAVVNAQTPAIAGCFNASQPLTQVSTGGDNSVDTCNAACQSKKKAVLGLHDDACWCGDELPPTANNVGPRFCDIACPGNSTYVCGGTDGSELYFTVWLTELEASVPNLASLSSSSTATSSTGTSTKTGTGTGTGTGTATGAGTTKSTGTATAGGPSPTSTGTGAKKTKSSSGSPAASSSTGAAAAGNGSKPKASSSGSDGGDQDVAIALGVIFGVAALALMGFLFWWTWRRRRRTGTYARYNRNSVDSGTALHKERGLNGGSSTARTDMSMVSPPESEGGGFGGPAIFVQQPTPATATLASQSSYDNGLAPRDLLTPGETASRASSDTDPYYTPLEQPSISHLNSTELASLRGQSQRPSSSINEDERDDVLSPLETIARPERKNSRDLINNFDFAFEDEGDERYARDERHEGFANTNENVNNYTNSMTPMPTMHMPGYFGTFYEEDGR